MLVLSRKTGQTILIDDNIAITVVNIGRGRVQLGVTAPRHVSIHREEIYQQIRNDAAGNEELNVATV